MLNQKHKWLAVLMLIAISVFAAGCMNNNPNDNNDTNGTNGTNNVQQQGTRMQQIQNQPRRDNDNTGDRVEIADKAAEKIVRIKGVKQANVLITRRNAYVAAAVDADRMGANQGDITPELEKEIADKVRATDPSIQKVYVSTNPEFFDRVNQYVADVGQGKPISGFFQQFNEMIQRIFPNAR
ncbi:YhcN/YlaJ family sporulation lipoprotein [Paenibacillus abyssi]|uniref:Sporulation protein n=1 Tax=Paenibacillus abyssi TaxID=1340531 RepID=A0A917CWL1_9BACL|nr:YhcN/YlaJ family sporulation lipoprotein [Paenibacillus abyssi]GGF99101.1 hypothetical protein GCM10010916_15480 [Paenibacillus abyssi]